MRVSKPTLTIGFACLGTALLAMLAADVKNVGGPEEAARRVALAPSVSPRASTPAPADTSMQDGVPDVETPTLHGGPQGTGTIRPRSRPTEVVLSSALVRPKPRPEANIGWKIVAAPRPRPRDPLADLVARRRIAWPGLDAQSKAPAKDPAARRTRLLAEAESLVEAPPRSLRDATSLACLAVSVYHEARNQPELGQHAVAAVILRRAEIPHRWEDTVCEVVRPVQFSYLGPDLTFAVIDEPAAWREAVAIAVATLLDGPHPDLAQADHYHRFDVAPAWNQTMDVVARVADHVFFRDPRSQRIE